jgi:iron complex outermembrane receptor protein
MLAGLLISLAASLVAAGETGSISGRALDSAGKPLAAVRVDLAGPVARSGETDAAGAYAFDGLPPGRYQLSMSTPLGNASAEVLIRVGEAASRDLSLGVPRVSETVSVSGIAPDGLAAVPGGTAVVDRADILDTKASNFKDVFSLTPGVLAQPRFGADESQFSIRGSGLRNNFHVRGVNLLVNGIPYQDADGFSDFEALEFMAASRVEVWKGANALRFGGNTSGGAVNLVTQDPEDSSALQLRTLGGSYGYFKGQLSSGGRLGLGDAGYYASFSGLTMQGYREHSAQTRERLMGNLNIPVSSDTDLVVDVMQAHVTEKLPGALTAEETANDPRQADPANVLFDWGRNFDYFRGGVRMTHRMGDDAALSVTGFASYRNMEHPIYLVLDQDSRNYGGEIRYTLSSTLFGKPNRLVAGFVPFYGNAEERDYVNEEGSRGELADAFATSAGNLGLYVEDQLDLSGAVTLIVGTGAQRSTRSYEDRFPGNGDRSDERTYEALTPKFGAIWSPSPGIQVFANVSRAYEAPLLLELKSYGSPGFLALEAQDTWQYEIGSRGKLGDRSAWSWDVSLFDLEIDNEIVNTNVRPFPDAPFTIPSYRNVPRTRHRGVEIGAGGILLRDLFGGGLSARAAYTYSDFRFVDDAVYGDNLLPGAPRHLVRAELRFDAPGGFWIAPAVDASPSPYFVDSANTASNARYVVWNMSAGWDGPAFGLFLQLTNLGDTVYSAAVQVDNDLGRYFEPANGRSVAGGIRWRMM